MNVHRRRATGAQNQDEIPFSRALELERSSVLLRARRNPLPSAGALEKEDRLGVG
jgi:hypothetical protein